MSLLWGNTKAEIKVYAADNGWVVEWSVKDRSSELDDDDSFASSVRRVKPKTSGLEIFTDVKKMIKFVESKAT